MIFLFVIINESSLYIKKIPYKNIYMSFPFTSSQHQTNQQIQSLKSQLQKSQQQTLLWKNKYHELEQQYKKLLLHVDNKNKIENNSNLDLLDDVQGGNLQNDKISRQNKLNIQMQKIELNQCKKQQNLQGNINNLQSVNNKDDESTSNDNKEKDNLLETPTDSVFDFSIKPTHSSTEIKMQQITQQYLLPSNQKLSVQNLQNNWLEQQQGSPTYRSPRAKYDQQQTEQSLDFFSLEQIQRNFTWQDEVLQKDNSKNGERTEFQQQNQQINLRKRSFNSQKSPQKGLKLIQGYFILQKINNFKQNRKFQNQWIKFANQGLLQKQKNLLEIVYRYTFRQQPLISIHDDPFDSRLNQIKYGTPYEDLIYSFDNFQIQEESRQAMSEQRTQREQNQQEKYQNEQPFFKQKQKLIKKSMQKKFVHCLIRPQITYIQNQPFQTEIMYAFISPFPFKIFFQDLHRTLHLCIEQIKFQIIKSQKDISSSLLQQTSHHIPKQKRIQMLSTLMKSLYQYCQTHCSNIDSYPIKIQIQTKLNTLKLNIQSHEHFKTLQKEYLQTILHKYNLKKISKILHYVLTEKQIVVVGTSRRVVNQIHQIIRMIIKPFYWVFPIVYRYSDHFQPFLSSPMPLIIGIVFDFNNFNSKQNPILTQNQFITIFVDEILQNPKQKQIFSFFSSNKPKYQPNDLRQIQSYQKDIQFLTKYLQKSNKQSKSNTSERIYKYMNRLRVFIQTGKIEIELSNFLIDFMETQMVQYYKDVLVGGSNKKLQKDGDQEYNCKEMMMTR